MFCGTAILNLIFAILVKEELNRVNYKKQVSKSTNAVDEYESPKSNEKDGYKQPQQEVSDNKGVAVGK